MGYLQILSGCMFAKKTTELINLYKEKKEEGENVLAINYDKDTRYGSNKIINHDGLSIPCTSIHSLDEIFRLHTTEICDVEYRDYYIDPKVLNAKYIFIDEAQFFQNLKSFVLTLIEKYDKHIIISGLDLDFRRHTGTG